MARVLYRNGMVCRGLHSIRGRCTDQHRKDAGVMCRDKMNLRVLGEHNHLAPIFHTHIVEPGNTPDDSQQVPHMCKTVTAEGWHRARGPGPLHKVVNLWALWNGLLLDGVLGGGVRVPRGTRGAYACGAKDGPPVAPYPMPHDVAPFMPQARSRSPGCQTRRWLKGIDNSTV